jgi:hypothetical protein
MHSLTTFSMLAYGYVVGGTYTTYFMPMNIVATTMTLSYVAISSVTSSAYINIVDAYFVS